MARFKLWRGDATSRSAIVAPLLGMDRCIGVLAIELPTGREIDVTTQAVVTLIAAQLATVARRLAGCQFDTAG